ncbi:MAG: GNAT family N-acetyltransferase [Chloroflexi bacterium]|nr:GNAT family N-acetyltransferase [Chloroflexota bacterium]
MVDFDLRDIHFLDADEEWVARVANEWGEKAARHIHITDGFSIAAVHKELLVGLIAVQWRTLPQPLLETHDAYIDFLEVRKEYRRRGIARHLIELAEERSRKENVYQLRAWSSEDKTQAIPMWQALGFGLCPAKTWAQGQEVRGYFVAKVL